ncbi:MAG: RNA pseudouridine synthase [Sandaracinaceae bacterium]|jgi:23S rRNA-/tRNA-specific pseudouridylate synthase|nr:RNA pseudouridine synthase [Sandaracinaceae bacterium]MBP7681606.1 RNA pseudouridine synthase [Deltaproteobacteria bacterium]MBK6812451.1 RNA pseudouridine synthase [Sandaracinaceae bacterium]MBK7777629.1 RNA pseudouridine synthase [Sandaracinaceae bacterium]MBK8412563.1 RNA pseudouridine synthase [Sandaracinaceae bacterium]
MSAVSQWVNGVGVVHRDAALLILAKPSGLPTTTPDDADCLVKRAQLLDPEAQRLHATSRLDAEVSGLVTFARTPAAAEALRQARADGRYGRRYIALTLTPPKASEGAWDSAISIDPRDRRKRVAGQGEQEKAARSRFLVAERMPLGALLHLFPETGRTHQLRVHALAAGAPLFGDKVYGGPTRATAPDGRVVTARRTMLHCAALRLPNVASGTGEIELTLDPPADWLSAYRGLGGTALP